MCRSEWATGKCVFLGVFSYGWVDMGMLLHAVVFYILCNKDYVSHILVC